MEPRSLRIPPIETGLACLLLAGSAWAIPSPDVVVSFFSNAAHLLALGGAYLGGRTLLRRSRSSPYGAPGGSPRLLLGLGVVLAASLVANFLQYRSSSDARDRRLTANLVRTTKQDGKAVKDVSLKTLDFSEQLVHPRGLDGADLEARLAEHDPVHILDVREDEEFAQARIPGSAHARYPDVLAEPGKYLERGARTVLVCWSGNRSGEVVEATFPKGWDVVFVRGGYEKWRAEGRVLEGVDARRRDPRDIPDYPNRSRLLDTDEVLDAMRGGTVAFLDNRYDKEFSADHLPGAISFPIRRMRTEEVAKRLEELPRDVAFVCPVYDRRSGFYATVLGSKLAASGRRYLGRYTVPHEFPPDAESAVPREATIAAGSDYGWLAPICAPLRGALLAVGRWSGSLVLGLLAIVVALRLLLLPFSIAANRSSLRSAAAAGRIEEAKRRHDDPAERRSALRALYREAGIRPGLSILALLAQLLALMALFRVVAGLEELRGLAFVPGWIDDLSVPDPWFLLPLVVGLATATLMTLGAERGGRARWIVPPVTGLALAALVSPLRAALPLYLAVSVGLAALEKAFVVASERRRARSPRPDVRREAVVDDGLVPLAEAEGHEGIGGKARNLARLKREGFPVPDGFVASAAFFGPLNGHPWAPSPEQREALLRAFRSLGAARVAVRSSALREDGSAASYAGIFESVLDVDEERLPEAVGQVLDSFRSERARAYGEASPPCVLVQRMLEPDWAGVVFTAHPLDADALLVEAVRGRGEDLVQGRLNPEQIVVDRESLATESGNPQFPAAELARVALRIEDVFGRAQDIEWAHADGRFHVLQSRDVTCLPAPAHVARVRDRERRRLQARAAGAPAGEALWKATALTEDLPTPTALSLSLMRALWDRGGAVEAACLRLGLPYDARVPASDVIEVVFGRLYVNAEGEARLFPRRRWDLSAWRIERARRDYALRFREEVAPRIGRFVRDESLLDLARMDDATLFEAVRRRWETFVRDHYAAAEVANVLADWSHRVVEKALGGTDLRAADFLGGKAPGAFARANALLAEVAFGRAPLARYLAEFGHRGEVDYELACPRFREVPDRIAILLETVRAMGEGGSNGKCAPANGNGHAEGNGHAGGNGQASAKSDGEALARGFAASLPRVRRRLFEEKVGFLREYETLKEDAKDLCIREIALLREAFVEIGRRRGLGSDVFHLGIEEVLALEDPAVRFDARVAARRGRREAFEGLSLPPTVCPSDLDAIASESEIESPASEGGPNGRLAGLAVSRGRTARGRARVVRSLEDLGSFRPGEILVAPYTEPAWSVVFPGAGGVVTEVGGTLCHTAILAREYGLTAVVGVEGATRRIATGDLVRIEPDGSVVLEGAAGEGEPASASRAAAILPSGPEA